jgi:hypothetical protein
VLIMVLAIGFVSVFSFGSSQCVQGTDGRSPVLLFIDSIIDLRNGKVLQGTPISAQSQIVNRSLQAGIAASLSGSCGCMTMQADGKPLKLPLEIPPGGRLPFTIEINTQGRGGLQRFRVDLHGQTADKRPIPPDSMEIIAYIHVPFVAVPVETYLEFESDDLGSAQTKVFTLFDDWPAPGLEIKEITSSAPDRLTWQLAPLSGEETIGITKVKRRFSLAASYRPAPGVEDFNETITIVPSDPRAMPLKLRIWGKVLQPYSITPRALVFHNASPSPTRFLFYQFRKPEFEELRIAALPSFLTGEKKSPTSGRTQLEFYCAYPAEAGKHQGEIVLETGPTRAQIKVPVTVYVER